VTPVGSTKSVPCDVRVLATTNRDMQVEIQEGRFREDLFFRLNVFPLQTFALSARPLDVVPIAAHMIARHFDDASKIPSISKEAIDKLQSYDWPGNVRELDNVVQRASGAGARWSYFCSGYHYGIKYEH